MTAMAFWVACFGAGVGSQAIAMPQKSSEKVPNQESVKSDEDNQEKEPAWIGKPVNLLKSDSLEGWEVINFGGEGDIEVANGVLLLEAGEPFTGMASTLEDLPKTNYEISLTGRKLQGTDFFCGLTFPVDQSHCSLIVGGWGGTLVGLSCIDDQDAARNDTNLTMKFEKKQWYKIRVQVRPERIAVWIDDKKVINKNIVGKKISLRGDVALCEPIGICSFQTDAEIKDFRLRRFKPERNPAETPGKSQPLTHSDQ